MLTRLHVINVCKFGEGDQECRYLAEDEMQHNVFHCMKLTSNKDRIDEAVEKEKGLKPTQYYNGHDGGYGDNVASTIIDLTGHEPEVIREGKGSLDIL